MVWRGYCDFQLVDLKLRDSCVPVFAVRIFVLDIRFVRAPLSNASRLRFLSSLPVHIFAFRDGIFGQFETAFTWPEDGSEDGAEQTDRAGSGHDSPRSLNAEAV